jgi:hypothetical protein
MRLESALALAIAGGWVFAGPRFTIAPPDFQIPINVTIRISIK